MAVFILLMIELFITLVLVLPLPRFIRHFIAKKIFTYNLASRVRFVSNFIIFGLVLAVSDALSTLRHLEQKEEAGDVSYGAFQDRVGSVGPRFDKERKFRAQRNVRMLLSFGAVTHRHMLVDTKIRASDLTLALIACYVFQSSLHRQITAV